MLCNCNCNSELSVGSTASGASPTNTSTFALRGEGTETVSTVEFLRRFVQHVLPDGFHEICHYGLNASPEKRKWARISGSD